MLLQAPDCARHGGAATATACHVSLTCACYTCVGCAPFCHLNHHAQSETEKVRTVAQAMIQTANMNAHLSGKEAHAAAEERAEKAAARATKEVAASREQMQLLKDMHSKELALFRSKVEALKAEHADALAALRTELTFVQEQLWQAQERTADLEGQLAAEVAERQRVERHRDALASTLKTFQAAMRQLASVSSGQDAAGGDSVSDVSSQEDFDQDEVCTTPPKQSTVYTPSPPGSPEHRLRPPRSHSCLLPFHCCPTGGR